MNHEMKYYHSPVAVRNNGSVVTVAQLHPLVVDEENGLQIRRLTADMLNIYSWTK
jgi:hypothetical protein